MLAILTPAFAPVNLTVRLPPGRSDPVQGEASGTTSSLVSPAAEHPGVVTPRMFRIFRPRNTAISPPAKTAAFLAAAIAAVFALGAAGMVPAAAHPPAAAGIRFTSPMRSGRTLHWTV